MNAIGKFALVLSSVVWIAADVQSVHATNGVPDLSLPHPYGGYVHPHWNDDCSEFWYVAFGPDFSETYWWVNCQTGEKSPVFDIPKLQQSMIKAGFDETARMSNLSLEDIKRVDGKKLQLDLYGSRWIYDPAANSLQSTNVVPPLPCPLPALPGPEASSSYVIEETTVNFFNLKKRKITVSQIMHDMSKVGLTSPSNWKGVQSWCSNEGDVFEIDDESGKTMGIFRATGNPSQIDIDALFDNGAKSSASTAPASQRSSMQPKLVFRGNNLFVADEKSGSENQLTSDGRPGDGYDDQNCDWERSPDSAKLFITRWVSDAQDQNLVQSLPPGDVLPRLQTTERNRPTDKTRVMRPELFDIVRRRRIPVQTIFNPSEVKDITWSENSKQIDFTGIDRDRHTVRMVRIDAETGHSTTLITEHSDTFVDFTSAGKCDRLQLSNDSGFLWTSERDGWNHAYFYGKDGKLRSQVTKGDYVVRGIMDRNVGGDPDSLCILKAGGFVPNQDPYYVHYVCAKLDGSQVIDMTPGDGTHQIQIAPNGQYYLDTYSRVDLAPITELYRIDDRAIKICEVDRADMHPRLLAGWIPPERFVAKGRDGKTDIYGVIYRPPGFDPHLKYPVIEKVYAGPQEQGVQKWFYEFSEEEALAKCGFIVVESAGMGTNFRSKAFHDVVWHNIAEVGFPDRMAWIKAAAAKYPQMDISRLGIYGTSSGAENAVRALESHNDFYHLAVGGFGIYDDRTFAGAEQWMGWPIGDWYKTQSDVEDASKLKGDLLLISGELDHTADPAFTMQMAGALVKTNKDFEFLELPNADHGEYGDYGLRRRAEFFMRHLLPQKSH